MAGMFDDLIPGNRTSGSISFDDLIPKKRGQHLSFEEGQALLAAEEQQRRMEGTSGTVGATLSGLIDGVPVLGPYMLDAAQRGAAGAASLIEGGTYDDRLKQAQGLTQAAQEAHPYVTTGANVAGAVGGTLPLVMAAPAAFGGGSGSLLMRSGASMLSGGAIGAADSGVRSGGDWDATKKGIMWGAGSGVAAPVAGKIIGNAARSVMDYTGLRSAAKMAGTTPRALSSLARTASNDGLDDAIMRSQLSKLGPDGMFADLGPNLRDTAGALANMPGPGKAVVRNALDFRSAGANARIAATVDETMGRNVIPSQIDDAITGGQHTLGPYYDDVFQNARAVDTAPIAETLESQMVNLRGDAQRAARDVRRMLNISGTDVLDPNPNTLFQTRQAIDGLMATEKNPQTIRVLTQARQQIDDTLARSVPGIKDIDANYAELARQREALTRGQSVLDHGRTAPRPSELARKVQDGALPQGNQIGPSAVPLRLSQGARAEVDRILGSNANDIARLNSLVKSEGDWNRARLATLFGQDKADRLFRVLDNELTYAQTKAAATGNSATAGRQQAIQQLGGGRDPQFFSSAYAAGGVPGAIRAGGIKLADKILAQILGPYRDAANLSLAEAITSNSDSLLDALAAARRQGGQPALVDALTKAILLGPGSTTGAR